MIFSILTLFPSMFHGPFSESIIKRAIAKKLVTIDFINIRDFTKDKYKTVDDHPYGGGAGMILRVDVVERALAKVKSPASPAGRQKPPARIAMPASNAEHSSAGWQSVAGGKVKSQVILLDPRGTPFMQKKAVQLSKLDHIILICGHYEGIDERVRSLVDEEISIGDYVLTGGEIPAMVLVDSVVRLIPQVLKKTEATQFESFSVLLNTKPYALNPLLEYPQYTRPPIWKNKKVPSVLLSGNHKKISEWQKRMAKEITKAHRPDLLASTMQTDLVK